MDEKYSTVTVRHSTAVAGTCDFNLKNFGSANVFLLLKIYTLKEY